MFRWDVFLAAGLRQPSCAARNSRIIDVVESVGMQIFAPGRATPIEWQGNPEKILNQNRRAIEDACLFLLIPDDAGIGVYYELGYADALGKQVLAFSDKELVGLGKMVEGRWSLIPPNCRASTIRELKLILGGLLPVCQEMRTNARKKEI